jgi:hypothetical protein
VGGDARHPPAGLPAALLASLKHAASLANPEFYKNENLRLSNWKTPGFVRCYTEDLEYPYLPRAMADKAADLVAQAGSRFRSPTGGTSHRPSTWRSPRRCVTGRLSRSPNSPVTSTACQKRHRDR